jgi:NAD+ synthase (glutamine-hydrolysing)
MAGGFAPLKDVLKTCVYRLARYRNGISGVIPERVITRSPSAELRPDQTDQDSLPEYDLLDPILRRYIEDDESVAEIVAEGYPEEVVRRVTQLVDRNEYKRRQAPPGVRISCRAFGRDRRYPITSGF